MDCEDKNIADVVPEPSPDSRAWSALADMHDDLTRLEKSVSARFDRLERKTAGGSGEQLVDNRTIGLLIVITVVPIALQVIGVLIAKWQSSS